MVDTASWLLKSPNPSCVQMVFLAKNHKNADFI